MTVLFAEGVPEAFAELPRAVQQRAPLNSSQTSRRGLMRGYGYFVAGRYLFYYSVSSAEVRIAAIIPAAIRLA